MLIVCQRVGVSLKDLFEGALSLADITASFNQDGRSFLGVGDLIVILCTGEGSFSFLLKDCLDRDRIQAGCQLLHSAVAKFHLESISMGIS